MGRSPRPSSSTALGAEPHGGTRQYLARSGMPTHPWTIRRLSVIDDATVNALAGVLVDCVEGGASVGFMLPLSRERAVSFWQRVAAAVNAGRRALLVAEDYEGICGTVQLVLDMAENQPH